MQHTAGYQVLAQHPNQQPCRLLEEVRDEVDPKALCVCGIRGYLKCIGAPITHYLTALFIEDGLGGSGAGAGAGAGSDAEAGGLDKLLRQNQELRDEVNPDIQHCQGNLNEIIYLNIASFILRNSWFGGTTRRQSGRRGLAL